MRIWWLFIECLLYDRSFMFIFPHYFSFYFFISYAFHQVGTWGSEELSLQTGVTKLLSTRCELSQGLPDSETSEKNSCCIQLNGCLSWYQVTCVAAFQTEFISWSRFALKTGSFTIHLTCGKKFTNVLLEKSNMLPECQLHANLHQTYLEVLSQYLPHYWSSICLSSSPSKLVPWAGIMVKNSSGLVSCRLGFSSQWDRFLIGWPLPASNLPLLVATCSFVKMKILVMPTGYRVDVNITRYNYKKNTSTSTWHLVGIQ